MTKKVSFKGLFPMTATFTGKLIYY